MNRIASRVLYLALLAPACLAAQARASKPDEAAVRAVVERYLHGLKFNDTTSFHESFWPQAKLFYVNKAGELAEWTQASWYATFARNAGKEEQGDLRMTAMEVTHDIASAKVVEDYPRSRYTDYLSLMRINGRWWIVNKLYTSEPRP